MTLLFKQIYFIKFVAGFWFSKNWFTHYKKRESSVPLNSISLIFMLILLEICMLITEPPPGESDLPNLYLTAALIGDIIVIVVPVSDI